MARHLPYFPLIAFLVTIFAAQEEPSPRFEVATIKTTRPGNDVSWASCRGTDTGGGPWLMGIRGKSGQTPPPPALGRCEITGVTLKMLVGMAYDYRAPNQIDQQIVGGPGWAKSTRFDVEAKADNPAIMTEERMAKMLQTLLADRFKLKLHRETRNISGYRLVVAKQNAQLRRVSEPVTQRPPLGGAAGDMNFNAVPLDALATFLSMTLGAPVQDKTGLTGNYSFSLQWTPNEHEFREGIPIEPNASAPSLPTALREQLGLKLESGKVPMPVIVIEGATKPNEN
jgi:uncharacterized protein (TIGR03435 family)